MAAISLPVRGDRRPSTRRGLTRRVAHLAAALVIATSLLIGAGIVPASAKTRTVRVGVYENEPKIFTDENGRPSGIFIDLLESVAEEEGWTLEYVHGEWSECLANLKDGTIDLMPDVAYSAERDRSYDFHKVPVVESWSYVYSSPNIAVENLADMDGLRVAVLTGSIQQSEFARVINGYGFNVELLLVSSLEQAFEAVEDGQADAALANHLFGDYFYRDYGLVKTPIVFNPVPLHFATAEGRNGDLLAAIDTHLEIWIDEADSPYYGAFGRWMTTTAARRTPILLYWILAAIGSLLLASGIMLMLLRWQVAERTAALQKAHAELDEHRRHLEELVEARTRQLAEANAAKGRFLARMSHELRTPLNSIIGFSSLLSRGMSGELTEVQTTQVEMIHRAGTQLLGLIDSVLDLSQVEAGAVRMHLDAVDGGAVVTDVTDALRPLAAEKGLGLWVELPDFGPQLHSDAGKIRQILLNLIGNAVKFTESGSVTVRYEPRPEGRVAFVVSDTGPGIPPEELARIFEAFHQAERPNGPLAKGVGLGLAISQDYARMLGGWVTAENNRGGGATFTLILPLEPPAR